MTVNMEPDQVPSDPGTAFQLGQISGQLRELVHSVGGASAKIDGLAQRVSALERAENRREGAIGFLQAVLKSPFIAWLLAIVSGVIAFSRGKIEL